MSSNVIAPPPGLAARLVGRWPEYLVLAGGVALVAGLVVDRTWETLPHPKRLAEPLVVALVAMAVAGVLRRLRGWSVATGLGVVAFGAVAFFAGLAPVVATLLLALAAMVLGRAVTGGRGALAVGLALVAGTVGWLLPLPIHVQWGYLLLLAAVAVLGRRTLREACGRLQSAWRDEVAAAPVAAGAAMLLLVIASIGCWLPTMQYDDLAYHLGLPFQLQATGRYALDPDQQVWALAPWAGDVLHGIVQVMAGAEARGAVNALWLLLAAAGIHRLSALLGATGWARWGAVGLFATLPLTMALAGGMQTELPAVAITVALACLVLRGTGNATRSVVAGGVLFGMLCALKVMHAAAALPLLAWAAWRHRDVLHAGRIAIAGGAALAIGGASYAYAWAIAGNPVLPLLNGTFGSRYFPPRDFADERWRHGLGLDLPWELTFDTPRFLEGFDGAFGWLLVAAAGAWALALADARTRGLALAATAGLLVALLPVQYARYLYPSLVLLVPALMVALAHAVPARRAMALVAALCLAQLAFYGSAHWMIRDGAVGTTVLAAGADTPVLERFAPERVLAARMRRDATGADGAVLAMGTDPPAFAELGHRSRTTAWYSARLGAEGDRANRDPDGSTWEALLRHEGVTDIILRDASLTVAQRAALARVHAYRVDAVGVAEWWRVPTAAP